MIEQITYLLFLRRLDDLHTLEENRAARTGQPTERRVFPPGNDPRYRPYDDLRWSRFKHFAPAEMFTVVGEHVFPFLRELGGDGSTYAHHMKDARFTIPTPSLLGRVVDLLDQVPMQDRDTKGDLYEYMQRNHFHHHLFYGFDFDNTIEIAAQGYDLSLNRYKEVVHEEVEHRPPQEILADLARLEAEIQAGIAELEEMLR